MVGKIIDTKEKCILKSTTFKPKVLLNNRIALLNLHDMSTEYNTGRLKKQADYKPRFIVVDINKSDILPVKV